MIYLKIRGKSHTGKYFPMLLPGIRSRHIFRAAPAPGVAKKYLGKKDFLYRDQTYPMFKFYNLETLLSVSSPIFWKFNFQYLQKSKIDLEIIF